MSAARRAIALDWVALHADLDTEGYAVTSPFLDRDECRALAAAYEDPASRFRSTVDMARYNFGRGQYKYFAYPLPEIVAELRESFYRQLVPLANDWATRLGGEPTWPETLQNLLDDCHAAGQTRPTPLLLCYHKDDFNCLHQDLYGPIHFPLQVIVLLSDPARDYAGGELILVEQRPRMQSRPIVVRLEQGAAAIIPVRERPRRGARGFHRTQMRHGVGQVTGGERKTLGLIFHDAA
jgi:hypothetical protein